MKKSRSKETGSSLAASASNLAPSFQGNSQENMARFRHQAAVQKAVELIQSRMLNPPSLNELACLSGFSRTYFSCVFKKVMGMKLQDYVIRERLSIAQNLLERPELKIKKVAYESGFRDPNYFCRVFKNETGCNPTHWRLTIVTESRSS